jgi:hypothetical protein
MTLIKKKPIKTKPVLSIARFDIKITLSNKAKLIIKNNK